MASQQSLGPSLAPSTFDSSLVVCDQHCRIEQPADRGTVRPNAQPDPQRGTHFIPFLVEQRDPVIEPLPLTPIELFQAFISEPLVKRWVDYTNKGMWAETAGPGGPSSRKRNWTNTTIEEVYLFLAVQIYMGLHAKNDKQSYWQTSKAGHAVPDHPIAKFVSYDRYQLLQRHIRVFDPTHTYRDDFEKTAEFSDFIQDQAIAFWRPGSDLAVDEAIAPFTGRAQLKVVIPNKPNPEGFKAWVIAEKGYFLQWIWHRPKQPLGPAADHGQAARKRVKRGDPDYLNPTQAVVVALVERLPQATYHVFTDNLFSSPNLFRQLRERGCGATGTCRTNCGLWQQHAEDKAADTKGYLSWDWNDVSAVPTADGLVSDTYTLFFLANESVGKPDRVER